MDDPTRRTIDPFRSDVFSTGVFERPGRILLIEDDESFCQAVTEILEHENHTVVCAKDGNAGLTAAREETPDLILIDVRLPGMDGFELCRRLKGDPELRYIPIILLTGHASPDIHVQAMQSGANDFLAKPFPWPVFKARVSALLKYRRAIQTLRRTRTELEQRVKERTAELQASNEKLLNEIAERRRIESALRESEERYELAERGANDGLWDWNLESDRIYFSPRWKSMLGCSESEIGGTPMEWFQRVHPEDLSLLEAAIDSHLSGATESVEHEYRARYKDGRYLWMIVRGMAVRNAQGKATRMAGSQSDTTVRKMAELQLAHNAFHDELTRLPNRALFMDRLDQAIKRHAAGNISTDGLTLAVLHLDIDRFKIINDSLGHMAGNLLLIEIGRRLRKCLRPTDTVARLGGDEFAVLIDGIREVSEAHAVAHAIHDMLKEPFKLRERDVFVTTSVGIALGKKKYVKPEDLIRDSETAMHRAKALGKARQETFHSGLHAQALSVLHLENDLRRASNSEEFVLYFQPIVALKTGQMVSMEALIRWKHPERGLVPPGEFLPLAEETELITPMSYWVLRKACTQLRDWQQRHPDHPGISISINLSGATFTQPELIKQIRDVLGEMKLRPESLKIEITEGVIMENIQAALATLAQLKAMNIPLLVDDFGTGYSSLAYLHRLPIDILKIDRSFISNLEGGDKNFAIVKTIMSLARNLELKVVAEGVETAHQAALLNEMGCDFAQGFHFARPAPVYDAEKWLTNGNFPVAAKA